MSSTHTSKPCPGNDGLSGTIIPTTQARIGQISFVNVLPVVLPFEKLHSTIQATIAYGSPAQLNLLFSKNELDIGSMSSFSFLEQGSLVLVPGLSISCKGPVGSVLFFSKKAPCELLSSTTIMGSVQSATSVNLLKILFSKHYGFIPDVIQSSEPDLDEEGIDAALVIGDRALAVDEPWSAKYHRIDLGAWWWETYKRPMVFGVWAARKQWVSKHPDKFAQIAEALKLAKNSGLTMMLGDVIAEAQRRTHLSAHRLRSYYTQELNFDLEDEHLDGLTLYQQLAREKKLLSPRESEYIKVSAQVFGHPV